MGKKKNGKRDNKSHKKTEPKLANATGSKTDGLQAAKPHRGSLHKTNKELEDRNLELEAALLAAREADKAKGEFLANMSHELRIPLDGIIGLTALTLESGLSEEQRYYLNTVHSSAKSLRIMINDILDFSKISQRELAIVNEPFGIRELFSDTVNPFAIEAAKKEIALVFDISSNVPEHVMGDPARLRQVLNNLIGNAVKFTDKGVVCAKVSVEHSEQSRAVLRFEITDTGIGIPPEAQEHIFKSFAQADSSISREFGGTGLGLAISSNLARLMGGEVIVTSKVSEGSNFHFSLPFKLPAINAEAINVPPQGPLDEPDTDRLNILLVEDDPVNQKVALAILEKNGHRVTVAQDGEQAVELFKGTDFDLILMDVMMPVMDGLAATRAIRQLETSGNGTHIPIIAITARAMEGDREKCIEAGMDDYIPKPVRIQQLRFAIKNTSPLRNKDSASGNS